MNNRVCIPHTGVSPTVYTLNTLLAAAQTFDQCSQAQAALCVGGSGHSSRDPGKGSEILKDQITFNSIMQVHARCGNADAALATLEVGRTSCTVVCTVYYGISVSTCVEKEVIFRMFTNAWIGKSRQSEHTVVVLSLYRTPFPRATSQNKLL